MPNIDILITGVGGQGTILAGKIISNVALAEGMDVKTAETHGMAQRGGSVVTHIRCGEKVYSPLIPQGDAQILLAFERLEALRWLSFLKPDGTVIVNTQKLEPLPVLTGQTPYPQRMLEEIEEKAGSVIAVNALKIEPVKSNPRTANVLLLGILAKLLPFPRESWEKVMQEVIPSKVLDLNLKAFATGWSYN